MFEPDSLENTKALRSSHLRCCSRTFLFPVGRLTNAAEGHWNWVNQASILHCLRLQDDSLRRSDCWFPVTIRVAPSGRGDRWADHRASPTRPSVLPGFLIHPWFTKENGIPGESRAQRGGTENLAGLWVVKVLLEDHRWMNLTSRARVNVMKQVDFRMGLKVKGQWGRDPG